MFTGNKDVDLKILAELDDRNVFNFCLSNKYLSKICKDEIFWKSRTMRKYPDYIYEEKGDEETWRKFYLRTVKEETIFLGNPILYEEKHEINVQGMKLLTPKLPDFYNQYNPLVDFWFHDQYDNWLGILEGFENEYHYVSSNKFTSMIVIKLVIQNHVFKTKESVLEYYHYPYTNPNVNEEVKEFLATKEKLYWLDNPNKAVIEFKNEINKVFRNKRYHLTSKKESDWVGRGL
jgi:hypothetical protein